MESCKSVKESTHLTLRVLDSDVPKPIRPLVPDLLVQNRAQQQPLNHPPIFFLLPTLEQVRLEIVFLSGLVSTFRRSESDEVMEVVECFLVLGLVESVRRWFGNDGVGGSVEDGES